MQQCGTYAENRFRFPSEDMENRGFSIEPCGDSTSSSLTWRKYAQCFTEFSFHRTHQRITEGLAGLSTVIRDHGSHFRLILPSGAELGSTEAHEQRPQEIEQVYELRDKNRVSQFILERPFVRRLLLEAKRKLEVHFGKHVRVVLEVLIDPEDHPAQPVLYACVQTPLSAEEASRLLDQFDEDWWLDASENADGELCITVDFV